MVSKSDAMIVREICDQSEWLCLTANHSRAHLLQSWGWGQLKGSFGWDPVRVVVQNGAVTAAAQILFKRVFGLSVAYVPRGPLWCDDPEQDHLLLKVLRRIAKSRHAAFLRLEPNVLEGDAYANQLHSLLQVCGFEMSSPLQPRYSLHVKLDVEPAKLLAQASKGHRADVRRAERVGVKIRIGSVDRDLHDFYRIMQSTANRANFGIHSEAYYRAAWQGIGQSSIDDTAAKNSPARLLLADFEGNVVAAFLIFGLGTEGQYMYSGANDVGLRNGANHLLQWHALQWVQSQGCKLYDLWGVPAAVAAIEDATGDRRTTLEAAATSDPLWGPYRFKKGWGGTLARYLPAYDQVYLRPVYWYWKHYRSAA
ncbi:MAG: peptidoglycan bridge formation glycyltransferase FemA/FemB family protein [Herpetosiphon sp.]